MGEFEDDADDRYGILRPVLAPQYCVVPITFTVLDIHANTLLMRALAVLNSSTKLLRRGGKREGGKDGSKAGGPNVPHTFTLSTFNFHY